MGAPAPLPACKTKHILIGRYRADLRVYIDCAVRLADLIGPEFDIAYDDAERARTAFENARAALNRHEFEHGC